ncbi:hypothetical protein [Sinimarinibacterium sp. CAU 1509]|uniref:hypothetical protein n=1 Tax=Sinimarinibacterium sp. CAU 1509 TaxID=2562283 RepID=UPI001B7FD0BC|nr:hypothetical protein [Sinimarinibacterium sp. CAU 1509]
MNLFQRTAQSGGDGLTLEWARDPQFKEQRLGNATGSDCGGTSRYGGNLVVGRSLFSNRFDRNRRVGDVSRPVQFLISLRVSTAIDGIALVFRFQSGSGGRQRCRADRCGAISVVSGHTP